MKFLLALSFKNLTRYTKRTVLTASAIAFGLGLFIVLDSFLQGAEKESEINLINYETAVAKLMHPSYLEEREKLPLKYLIEEPENLMGVPERIIPCRSPQAGFQGRTLRSGGSLPGSRFGLC